jgi:hypothetical protein
MLKHKLVDFIIEFQEEVDKEISEMKLFVCALPPGGYDGPELICEICSLTPEHDSSPSHS